MKIILAISDYKGKNVVFATDTFRVFSLEEAVGLVKAGALEDISLVRRSGSIYLRTKKNVPKERELGTISLTDDDLITFSQGFSHAKSTPALSRYLELYRDNLVDSHELIKPIRNLFRVPIVPVRDVLVANKNYIFSASKHFEIDPFLLSAILIDEIAGILPFEPIMDRVKASGFGFNTSVGVSQMMADTANNLIRKGLYNPNPKDSKLPFKRMNLSARLYLYPYLFQPKHNIFFAAALIKSFIDDWRSFVDLTSRPKILATLYHLPYKPPRANPDSNERGVQIVEEFYPLANKWLR